MIKEQILPCVFINFAFNQIQVGKIKVGVEVEVVVVTIIKINVDMVETTRAPRANPVGVGEGATRDLVTVEVVNKVEVEAEVITHLIIILAVISSILYRIRITY